MKTIKKANKRIFVLVVNLLIIGMTVSAQSYYQKKETAVPDTIYRLGGRKIVAFIQKVNQFEVDYKFTGDPSFYSIDKKQIEKIVYRTGKVEVFNKPVFIEIDENSWEAVLVTYDKDDVKGMYKYGEVDATSSPGAKNKKKALSTATIRLQKKAANMSGAIVYVTRKEPRGGYGEIPTYYLKGDVYGYNPLPEEDEKPVDRYDD